MCFEAANALNFNEPSVLAIKLVPHLNGFNHLEKYGDYNEESIIVSSDDSVKINEKLEKLAEDDKSDKNENERDPNIDVACQYLGFLEKDNDKYLDMIKNYKNGKLNKTDIINRVKDLIQDLLKNIKEKDNDNNGFDIDEIMIK